ncbi:MAG: flippase-like domain-containing protein [Rhodospirillaceae bacterium]|nr:flippase-like domain-containing protein [Rhodospirillaceae bacterium]MBL6930647.1 flippase-like domain-containing protein [Rhodospirillales bacterium]MBL6942036.1 flippase-like domain-containing protein [Rhodospirillales bacterium]
MSKKHIALALKFLVSGGLIWMLVDGIDLGAARDRILAADVKMLGLVLLLSVVQIGICVIRWRVVLGAIRAVLSFADGLRIYLMGFFFNQALPSSVGGDAVRVYKAYKGGLSLSCAINGVMLERVATVLGLIALVVIATPFFIDRVGPDEAAWIIPFVSLLGVGGVTGLIVLMFLDRLPSRISHWRFVRGLAMLAADSRRVFLSPVHAVQALGWSFAGHVNVALTVYLLALSLDLQITWLDCMVLIPPVLLVMTLPISIAGWGVREQAMVTAFALIGVPGEGALALSIMFGLLGLLFGLPGGVVWMMSADRKIEAIDDIPAK